MSILNNIGFSLMIIILGGYYGLVPLFGFDVWIRNKGWVQMDVKQSLFNISIALIIFFYIKYLKKDETN
jgi:hypothetical protein